jgi:hypothetical protein
MFTECSFNGREYGFCHPSVPIAYAALPSGETEEELLQNAKRHGIEVHGYTEESWNDEIAKNSQAHKDFLGGVDYRRHKHFLFFLLVILVKW